MLEFSPWNPLPANLNCAAAPREVPAGSWDRVLQITLLGCYQTPVALLYIYSFNSRLNQLTPGRKPCTNCLPHVRLTAANCMDGKTISLHFNTVLVDDSHSCSGQGRLCRAQNAAHCMERQTWTTAPQNLPSSLSGVGDHHLKLRSAAGLQIRLSEMQTNFFNSYFLSGKGRENFTRSVCLRIFFSSFSWPHEYNHTKVQKNQNWIHILNLAVCGNWILILSPSLNSLSKTLPLKAWLFSEGPSYPLNWRGW